MSMLTFLKKVGQDVVAASGIVSTFAPVVEAAVPSQAAKIETVSTDFAQVAAIIQQVEVMGQVLNQPGADKLRAAAPMVAQAILQSSIMVNHEIANPALFQQAATKIADGMADLLNSLKADVPVENKVA